MNVEVPAVKRKLEVKMDGVVVESEEFEFDNNEIQLIRDYCANAWRLRQSAIFNNKAANRFTISYNENVGLCCDGDPIDDEAWDAGMLRFRPILLNNEPSSFYRINSLVSKRIKSSKICEKLRILKKQYSGKLAPMQPYWVDRGNHLSLNHIFDLWLNAFEYHCDQDKREFFERTGKLAPELKMRYYINMHAVEKLRAIMGLFQLLVDLLGNDIKPMELRTLEAKERTSNG